MNFTDRLARMKEFMTMAAESGQTMLARPNDTRR